MKKNGFTLLEIIIAVGILCLILAIALPVFSRMRQTAKESQTQAELKSLLNAVNMFYGYTGRFPSQLSELSDYLNINDIENKYVLNPNLPLRTR